MLEAHPTPIVHEVNKLAHTLQRLTQDQVDSSLAMLEKAVLEAVRAALPALLSAVLGMSQRSLRSSGPSRRWPCPNCTERSRLQSWRPRTVTTICGRISFERPWCVCAKCGHGFSPTDEALDLGRGSRVSAGLKEWLVELGAKTSFLEAAGLLKSLTGLVVSPETVRQRTEARGAELEVIQEAAAALVLKTHEPAAALQSAPGELVVETDGVMVHYLDGWHEMKIGLIGGLMAGKVISPSYVAMRAEPQRFGPRLLAEAARRGSLEVVGWEGSALRPRLAVLREAVVLGDGAHWIWNLAAEHFGERKEIVDFYHASEHIWTVAKALLGDTKEASTWATALVNQLWEQGAAPVEKALETAEAPSPEAQQVLRRERGYFRTNAARMAYPDFRAAGLPIGSGAVESAARHLVQQRLKRAGARWSEAGAQYVMNVRCALVSTSPKAA